MVFSFAFCEIFKNTFFTEDLWTTTSIFRSLLTIFDGTFCENTSRHLVVKFHHGYISLAPKYAFIFLLFSIIYSFYCVLLSKYNLPFHFYTKNIAQVVNCWQRYMKMCELLGWVFWYNQESFACLSLCLRKILGQYYHLLVRTVLKIYIASFLLLVRYILLFSKILEATNWNFIHDILNVRRKQIKHTVNVSI